MSDFFGVILVSVLSFIVNLIIPVFGIYFIVKYSLNLIQKQYRVLGSIFCVTGVFFMIFFGYIRLAHYSKLPYSILADFQNAFYTEVNYDKDYIIKKDLNGHYRICDGNGKYFTGTIKTYFQKLRFSPIKSKENGISYFIDGYLIGSSQNPIEPMFLGNNFGETLSDERYKSLEEPVIIFEEYEKLLKDEVLTWGDYILVDKKGNFNKNYKIKYAYCIKNESLMKREIIYYKNGVVSLIRPYRLDEFNEWVAGGGNYFSFDSLGYLIVREKWNKNGTIDYRKIKKVKWEASKFIKVKEYTDILEKYEVKDIKFKNEIFSPKNLTFLENGELWDENKSNFENVCLILNNEKYFEKRLKVKLKNEKEEIKLSKKEKELFSEAINRGKLITSIEEDPEMVLNKEKKLQFIILDEKNREIGSFLYINNKFYMKNGIYIFSLEGDEFKEVRERMKESFYKYLD